MKRIALLSVILIFVIQVGLATGKGKWQPLFGENYAEATYDKKAWFHEKGVLTATEDQVIWAKGEYENFALKLEFRNEPGTNSGVIVYCTDNDNWIPNSVEIQIADDHNPKWGDARKDYQCGAIFGHLPAKQQKVVNKPGEWNTFEITCKGQKIEVVLNGKKVTSMNMKHWTSGKVNPDGSEIPSWLPTPFAELPTKGTIGLQGKHGDASISFRNVFIRSL
jgi:hypothetical protein